MPRRKHFTVLNATHTCLSCLFRRLKIELVELTKVSKDFLTLKMLKGAKEEIVEDLDEADHALDLVQDQKNVAGEVEADQGSGK